MENKDDSSNNPSGETTKRKVKIIKKKVKKKEGEVNKEKEPESNSPVQNKEETQQEEKTPIKKTVKKIITKNKVELEITPVKVSNPNNEIIPEQSTLIQKDIKLPSSSEKYEDYNIGIWLYDQLRYKDSLTEEQIKKLKIVKAI